MSGAPLLAFGDGFILRRAGADDRDALARICLLTGDAGHDASGREDDPQLIGQIYAVPYQALEPEFAFLIEGPDGPAGYLLGALDTPAFNAKLARDWYPALRARHADPGPDKARWQGSDWARHMIHHLPAPVPASLSAYPSHGHIDLLAPARGRGIGRRAMAYLEARLTERGSMGLHLGVAPQNEGALRFYAALGFARLQAPDLPADTVFMAKRLENARA